MTDVSIGGYRLRGGGDTAAVLCSPLLEQAGVSHGFATRNGGVSTGGFSSLNFGLKGGDRPRDVRRNLARLARQVGGDVDRLYRARQVHEDRVIVIRGGEDPDRILQEPADALATGVSGVTVGVITADCVPVLFAEQSGRAVAAAHAGWRGIVAGVLQRTIRTLGEQLDSPVNRLLVAVGPCIGVERYEVGPEVAAQFEAYPDSIDRGRGPRPHLDLTGAVRRVLLEAGVSPGAISSMADACTFRDSGVFFSYRRDGAATGHHLSVVQRPE